MVRNSLPPAKSHQRTVQVDLAKYQNQRHRQGPRVARSRQYRDHPDLRSPQDRARGSPTFKVAYCERSPGA
jgi:hypothetical protein